MQVSQTAKDSASVSFTEAEFILLNNALNIDKNLVLIWEKPGRSARNYSVKQACFLVK